ncbi:MAG: cytochrome c oxidase assembly protein [Solirubrobacteraceae bacterium]
MLTPAQVTFAGQHWGEFLPPLLVSTLYVTLFLRRTRTLARERRPVPRWRIACFISGAALLAIVQIGPFDALGDQMLIAHMTQHIVIGDFCSLLIVLGLTGPVIQPLMHVRLTRPLRIVTHPVVALVLWTLDLYAWHLPIAYQLAIRHDLVHALEHACLLWFGAILWLGLIGPLPKPRWFSGWSQLAYIVLVRFLGAVLANVLIWAQTVFYPVYDVNDRARGLNPLSDQNLAGGLMMIEQMVLTTLLLGWLFYRLAVRDEQRQALMDLAHDHGIALSDERAARAAAAGAAATERLRERMLDEPGEAPKPAAAHAGPPGEPVSPPAATRAPS